MSSTATMFFEFASTYSYIAAMRAPSAAAEAGVTLRHRPFLLGPVFAALNGVASSPFTTQPLRGRYMWRDMERLCEKHGLAFRKPSTFPRGSLVAARVACLGEGDAWLPSFVQSVYVASFAEDRDIADAGVVKELLESLRLDASAILEAASTQPVKDRLRAHTDEAIRIGIFGAPTFVVGEELFWGQDRMDDALAFAARSSDAR
jgi:2-hydroxychromene-2-carboxylate isomerase